MASTFTIRVTREFPSNEEMDTMAVALGMSRNQLLVEGARMMCAWDPEFYQLMDKAAARHKMTVPAVMQAMLLRRLAEDAAETDVWGPHGRMLPEFWQTSEGPLGARELYDRLYQSHHRKEGQRYAKLIQEEIGHGRQLAEHEQEILRQYGSRPKSEHDAPAGDDELTLWESESGYTELIGGNHQ